MEVGECLLCFIDVNVASGHQGLDVQLSDASAFGDRPIHEWLGVARVVTFVVTVAPIADHVDDDIFLKCLPIFPCELCHSSARFWVVTVHVENRNLNRLCNIGAVQRRSRELWSSREPNLVIDDEVNGATDAVSTDIAHRQAFSDDALACERSISVNEQRQNRVRKRRINSILA